MPTAGSGSAVFEGEHPVLWAGACVTERAAAGPGRRHCAHLAAVGWGCSVSARGSWAVALAARWPRVVHCSMLDMVLMTSQSTAPWGKVLLAGTLSTTTMLEGSVEKPLPAGAQSVPVAG